MLKDLKEQMPKEKYQLAVKEALEDLANSKAKEIYGDILDDCIFDRLIYEIVELSKCCNLDVVIDVEEEIRKKKETNNLCLSRLSHSNSLLFYLLGIGSVNPLPKHAYCPNCHTFYWGNKKTDLCECCGEAMVEDGYDLPFELLLDEIKRDGLRFDFSSTKSQKHGTLPIRFFECSLIKLAKELGFTQERIEKNEVGWEDTKLVIQHLTEPYKRKQFIYNHHSYVGIPDLGTDLAKEVFENCFEGYESFDDFVKVVAMLHGTGVIDANKTSLCDKDVIATRDELYRLLIKSQLSKDDALLVCRETRLCGKGQLSKLSEYKLIEAGVEDKYIDFIRNTSYIFHKGHAVAHTRLMIKIAKIYLEDPLRYYKVYFAINKQKLLKMDKNYDFLKGFSENRSTDLEEIYLAAIDLIERGFNPKQLIEEVLK